MDAARRRYRVQFLPLAHLMFFRNLIYEGELQIVLTLIRMIDNNKTITYRFDIDRRVD